MKRIGSKVKLGVILMIGLAGVSISAKDLLVDVQEVYTKYNKAIEADEKLNQLAEEAQKKMDQMVDEGIKMEQAWKDLDAKASNPALTEDAKKKFRDEADKKGEEIQQKQLELTQFQQEKAQSFAQRRQATLNLHLTEIRDAVEKVAKPKGARKVLNKAVVLYSVAEDDITEEVIKELNGTAPVKKAAPAAGAKKAPVKK